MFEIDQRVRLIESVPDGRGGLLPLGVYKISNIDKDQIFLRYVGHKKFEIPLKASQIEPEFKIVNGIKYHYQMPKMLVGVLEHCRVNKTDIKVYIGNPGTGEDTLEVLPLRQTGSLFLFDNCLDIRVPSYGCVSLNHFGPRIIQLRDAEGYIIYRHSTYYINSSIKTIYKVSCGEVHKNFNSEIEAQDWLKSVS